MARVDLNELEDAMIIAGDGGAEAWVCRETGKIFIRSDDLAPELEPLPDDIDTSSKYVRAPSQRDLDLGELLVLRFTRQYMPADEEQVATFFRKRRAYGRFSDIVDRRGLRDAWHTFREAETKAALRAWCEEHGLQPEHASGVNL